MLSETLTHGLGRHLWKKDAPSSKYGHGWLHPTPASHSIEAADEKLTDSVVSLGLDASGQVSLDPRNRAWSWSQ